MLLRLPQLGSFKINYGALGGDLAKPEADMSLVLHWLYGAGLDYLEEKERDFAKLVEQKQQLYGAEQEHVS